MAKRNVILDTDISNEIDDQFALAYLIRSLDDIDLQAITIAPFGESKYCNTRNLAEGTSVSFETACKILDMLHEPKYKDIIYKGAISYTHECKELNAATSKIIELAKANEHTTVVAIGAITNVALALYFAPEIASKIDVIWLGGHSFLCGNNNEYNFRQDVEGVRIVFESGVDLTVIPCRNVASELFITVYELEHYLGRCGEIGNYLCNIYKNTISVDRVWPDDVIGEGRSLWDISAIAYLLSDSYFETTKISCPVILDDTSYEFTSGRHNVTFVNRLKRSKIYKDFFMKMGYRI